MKLISTIFFYLKNRFILFFVVFVLFLILNKIFGGSYLPSTETKDLWFYSGLFMILFSIIFIEPFYTSPKNVITNAIPLLLVLISIQITFKNHAYWWILFCYVILLLLLSLIALFLSDNNKSPDAILNKWSDKIKNIVVVLGKGKVIYSVVFLSILILYKEEITQSYNNTYFIFLSIMWGCVLLINPKLLHNKLFKEGIKEKTNAIGEIFGVQSKKIFLVKLFEDRNRNIKKFDIVKFRYSMQDSDDFFFTGIIFDTYLLNQEKWTKVLQLGKSNIEREFLQKNIVYKVVEKEEIEKSLKELNVENFVGVVIEGSKIGSIKFEYSKKNDDLQEGDVLELKIGKKRLFYQVVSGITEFERLENKNETGFIEAEAIQLGEWDNEALSFQKFGWVPQINTPIFKANTAVYHVKTFEYPEFQLGLIPDTSLPSIINLHDAVSHHLALLGVTGSGKSYIARELIDKLSEDTKIVCVDFTGEWKKEVKMKELNKDNLDDFLNNTVDNIGLVELPVMSNTVKVIETTEKLFSSIFDKAKEAYDSGSPKKICLVLEEAHTIVPESTFLGVNNWDSKALVNKIGQIALQGRKYGVGMMVIAQRTANVSKTVLTQCNTIICFQAFDETSFNFLGNYVGHDLVKTLPNLKQYHAIVSGKAIKANIPMIVNLERKTE